MKKIIWIVLALILIGAVGFKVKQKIDQRAALRQQTIEQKGNGRSGFGSRGSMTSMVQVLPVSPQSIKETLKLTGEIKADQEISVQPRINGRLLTILVAKGERIRQNQLIAIMDDENIRIQMQQSEANIAGIKANIRQSELNVNRAKTDRDRYKELLEKKYISQRDFDNMENTYLSALSSKEVLESQLASAEKNYDLLKLQLSQTKVYSSISGYVIDVPATIGMNLTTGSTILTVATINPVKLVFTVDQRDTTKFKKGIAVKFSCDIYPNEDFSGVIREVAPSYDPKTRRLTLEAKLPNDDKKLLPGIFGTAEILVGGKEAALVIPNEAIVTRDNKAGVFVVNKDKEAEFRPVVVGLQAEGNIEITEGLKPGELVVIMGQNRLRDGQQVEVMKGRGKNASGKGGNFKRGAFSEANKGERNEQKQEGENPRRKYRRSQTGQKAGGEG